MKPSLRILSFAIFSLFSLISTTYGRPTVRYLVSQTDDIVIGLDSKVNVLQDGHRDILSAVDEAETDILSAVDVVESTVAKISNDTGDTRSKVDDMQTRVTDIDSKVDDISSRTPVIDSKIDVVSGRTLDMQTRVTDIDTKVDAIDTRTRSNPIPLSAGATLSTGGRSYILTQDVVGDFIISGTNVSLDLNDHSVTGSINISAGADYCTIRDGRVSCTGASEAIAIQANYCSIMSCSVAATNTTAGYSGITSSNDSYLLIKNCTVTGSSPSAVAGGAGISFSGDCRNHSIIDCILVGGNGGTGGSNGGGGITINATGSGHIIDGCTVIGGSGGVNGSGVGGAGGAGIACLGGASNIVIQDMVQVVVPMVVREDMVSILLLLALSRWR
jgi:hypothetical protein